MTQREVIVVGTSAYLSTAGRQDGKIARNHKMSAGPGNLLRGPARGVGGELFSSSPSLSL